MKITSPGYSHRCFPFVTIRTLLLTVGVAFGATLCASAHDVGGHPTQVARSEPTTVKTAPVIQVEGILAIIHADYFAQGKSTHTLVVHEDNGRDTPVRFAGPLELGRSGPASANAVTRPRNL